MSDPSQDPATNVLDLDVSIGAASGDGVVPGHRTTVGDLLAQMDRLGVEQAVTYHVVAREHAPIVGNSLLLEEIGDSKRLIPAFVVLPPYTNELPPIPELIAQMRDVGVRLARIFPASGLAGHRFALREWCIGELLSAFEEHAVPLAIDFSLFRRGEPPWDDIGEIASAHPDLRIALVDVQGRNNRNLYALMERFPNVYVGSGGLNVHTGLEHLCNRFGAHRVFFSSGWPARSLGAARFVVDRSGLTESQREHVFSGTARRLLATLPSPAGVPS